MVSGLSHAPAALSRGKDPDIARIESWVDPKDGLKIFELKILPYLPVYEPRIFQPVA